MRWVIAAVAIIDRMAAKNRKISIIMLSKIECLVSHLFYLIFIPFVYVDGQGPSRSLVLLTH